MSMPLSSVKARLACFFCGGAASATLVMLLGAGGDRGDASVPAVIDQEPVLLVDVSGFGIAGPLHSRLGVYSDGTVMVAEAGAPFNDGSACVVYVDPQVVADLIAELREAGAFAITDSAPVGADIPVTTATVFHSAGNGVARARTFSYTVPLTPAAEEFASIVQTFRSAHAPPTICSGGG